MTLEFHPIANAFPLMDDRELAELTADIKANGLKTEIDLYQGRILDGRNRYRACQAAGVVVRTRNFAARDEEHAISFAISANLKRKQYSKSQLEAAAAELANLKRGDNQHTGEDRPNGPSSEPISQAEAAKKLGVSHRNVKRAAAVRKADPTAFQEVKAGKTTTGAAERKIRARQQPSKKKSAPPGQLMRLPPGSRPKPGAFAAANEAARLKSAFAAFQAAWAAASPAARDDLKPSVVDVIIPDDDPSLFKSSPREKQLPSAEKFIDTFVTGLWKVIDKREEQIKAFIEAKKDLDPKKRQLLVNALRGAGQRLKAYANKIESKAGDGLDGAADEPGVESKAQNAILPSERRQLPAPNGKAA